MPPVRTVATKPVKTERSHEENQERAYIAASRRSDRSLEARIESARRASEIHKKRTGRALRVTEQDVINEEMYEEEDDDLPAQYRRFAAHLQNQSLWMGPKYESYMIANTAMRHAMLQQAMGGLQQQQFTTTPFFAYNHAQASSSTSAPYQSTQVPQSPNSFRQPPYPTPNSQFQHQRSASIATPQPSLFPGNANSTTPLADSSSDEHRRMSLPTQTFQPTAQMSPTAESPQQMFNAPFNYDFQQSLFDPMNQIMNFGPLSPSLPLEQQQIVGTTLNPMHPSTQYLMGRSEGMPQPFSYNYNPNGLSKPSDINQTLTSNALGITPSAQITPSTTDTFSNPPSATNLENTQTPTWDPSQDTWFDDTSTDFKALNNSFFTASVPGSGAQTPGDIDFSEFLSESRELGGT